MTTIEFIEKNVIKELLRLGYDESACNIGAREAVSYYRRASQSSKKGKIFDDCLFHAKLFAKKHTIINKRTVK